MENRTVDSFCNNFTPEQSLQNGDGYGDGDGYGEGSGDGDGYGDGSGSGDGDGYGDGSGSGDWFGDGYENIASYNDIKCYYIDSVPTLITSVKGNVAKGFILNKDFTLSNCYIVKQDNVFAHGKTLKEAQSSLIQKLIQRIPVEERIEQFVSKFKNGKKYPAKQFYDWHHSLTGSCSLGRDNFCLNHNINISTDKLTVKEFIGLTENSYGADIIIQLKKYYKEN
jgi:hypothetical protein